MDINIDDLTIGQAKQLAKQFQQGQASDGEHPYKVGSNYLIRTVTNYVVGNLMAVTPQELVLTNAAWVADMGRFHDALSSGQLNEVEPYLDHQEVIVGRGAIVDACVWSHDLPREQK